MKDEEQTLLTMHFNWRLFNSDITRETFHWGLLRSKDWIVSRLRSIF